MSTWAVIVAAGDGLRLGGDTPKVLYPLHGRALLSWTLAPFSACDKVDGVCIVASNRIMDQVQAFCEPLKKPHRVVQGGKTRGESVLRGLCALPEDTDWVAIHDGARPCLTLHDLLLLLDTAARIGSAVAGQPSRDTLQQVDGERQVAFTPERSGLWTVQTPQCFAYGDLLKAYLRCEQEGQLFTDDAAVYRWAGHPVQLVETRSDNFKLTTPEDIPLIEAVLGRRKEQAMRVGTGYDVHVLVAGRRLILGGVDIPHDRGLAAHSDGDVLAHAVMDALLGAAALEDIGALFPPEDDAYLNADSMVLLSAVAKKIREAGWRIENVDATIIAQRPKLMGYRLTMRENMARAMDVDLSRVAVKATTSEGLGYEGRQEGITVQAAALLRQV